MFNLYDAGNFMWGAWMNMNGYPLGITKKGAHVNEFLHGNFNGDTEADQKAIQDGYNHSENGQ